MSRAGAAALVATVAGLAVAVPLVWNQPPERARLVVAGGAPAQRVAPPRAVSVALPPQAAPQNAYAGWAQRVGAAAGIPSRALEAYAVAQAELAASDPDCGITWVTLAGIGYVESAHGTLTGGLRPDGQPVEPVVGIRLDGGPGVAAIADTDDGLLDGDAAWDRAVGPFQFLPSTWADWTADGDVDGLRRPQDIDDAAVAAAGYLCASGDLTTPEGWQAAVLSYNRSEEYVADVLSAADEYAAAAET